jgi:gamma-glutamyltranspeptidase
MTGGAINIETLLAALKVFLRDRERKHVDILTVYFPGVAGAIDPQLTSCYRSFYHGPSRASITKKVSSREGVVTRLDMHILAATAENDSESKYQWESMVQLPLPPWD